MMKVMIMSVMLIATTTASFYGDAAGNIYVGMMLASQSNMNNTDTDCFVAAQATNEEIAFTFDTLDPSVILNNFQVLQIKLSTTLETCNLQVMLQSVDSRMSSLDFTLGIISNVMSQIGGGFQTQNWDTRVNTNESPVYITYNILYPYVTSAFNGDSCAGKDNDECWVWVGKYTMLLIVSLLNFQSPSVSVGLATF